MASVGAHTTGEDSANSSGDEVGGLNYIFFVASYNFC